jgi:hypothetical protein
MEQEKLFKKPKEVFEEQLNDLFVKKEKKEKDKLLEIFSLLLSKDNQKSKDLLNLYHFLGMEDFIGVVTVLEKKNIEFPSRADLKEAMKMAVIFYYKEELNYSWEQIKKILPFEFSSISYSFKIKSFNKFLIDQLKSVLKEK